MICRSHAFCESHEWYIIIGRWVIACNGYSSCDTRALSSGSYQNGSGSKYLASPPWSVGEEGCGPSDQPCPARRNFCSGSGYICTSSAIGGGPHTARFFANPGESLLPHR